MESGNNYENLEIIHKYNTRFKKHKKNVNYEYSDSESDSESELSFIVDDNDNSNAQYTAHSLWCKSSHSARTRVIVVRRIVRGRDVQKCIVVW